MRVVYKDETRNDSVMLAHSVAETIKSQKMLIIISLYSVHTTLYSQYTVRGLQSLIFRLLLVSVTK